jgi:hypothetical protein
VWKEEGYEGLFSAFEKIESLVGSHVEEYAREVGDIDDEEWAERNAGRMEEGEDENDEHMSPVSEHSDEAGSDDSEHEEEDIKSAVRI